MRFRVTAVLTLAATLSITVASAGAAPRFGPAIRLNPAGHTEPRVAVGPNDHRFIVTNDESGAAVVFSSTDRGANWAKTPADFPGQTSATIDTDIVTFPSGRVLASELDTAGLNFPTAFTDDEGKTWTSSSGSNTGADQDRQYFAVGKAADATSQPPVYLVFHNLGSGLAQHNVYVATSTDGGATFGAPVPVTLPGDDAFNDLQCADGYQTSMHTDPKTGRIYVVFITRAAPQNGVDAGGCGASVTFGTVESNIVSATRIWVATSPDNSPGSWKLSLAVDKTDTKQVIAMQFPGASLDNQGGFWLAYPLSPNPYPDYNGASLEVTHADPDLKSWSKPVQIAPPGGPGNILTHLAVGDPGKFDLAYYEGELHAGSDPVWMPTVIQSLDGGKTVTKTRLSDKAALMGTASALEGACSDPSYVSGIQNGYTCPRATDVFGIALDANCNAIVTWPGDAVDGFEDSSGTFAATQSAGTRVCGTASDNGGASQSPTGPFCRDFLAPQVGSGRLRANRKGFRLAGMATDKGCVGGEPNKPLAPARVQVAVGREAGKRCAWLSRKGKSGKPGACAKPVWLRAKGTATWTFALKGKIRKGHYRVLVRAVDQAGNTSLVGKPIRARVR